ncbi:hypothetical protein, partial [Staphylococcus pseudintermedius]|uniref:hypothetical protein n=1 Tax=Staphylococcus pseudintermedius TaxID=283734 RepID=UPI0036F3D714
TEIGKINNMPVGLTANNLIFAAPSQYWIENNIDGVPTLCTISRVGFPKTNYLITGELDNRDTKPFVSVPYAGKTEGDRPFHPTHRPA